MTSAAVASLIVGSLPLLLALAGVLVYRERLNWQGWGAVALSLTGVALTVGKLGNGNNWLGADYETIGKF
jgi:drug/metabolite transporter (DMT)-like permease